jgi:hypothetical protein
MSLSSTPSSTGSSASVDDPNRGPIMEKRLQMAIHVRTGRHHSCPGIVEFESFFPEQSQVGIHRGLIVENSPVLLDFNQRCINAEAGDDRACARGWLHPVGNAEDAGFDQDLIPLQIPGVAAPARSMILPTQTSLTPRRRPWAFA